MTGENAVTRFGADHLLTIGRQPPVELVEQDGPLPPARAVDVVLQVIAGLEAAAAVGVLHRDIKPSNCFVDPSGAVKIGDCAGALRLLGATVASRDGAPLSRSRAMFRSFIAWSPALVAVALILMLDVPGRVEGPRSVLNGVIGLTAIASLVVGAVCSILAPRFSLHDRIARTVVIPL